jgi:pyruvate/2-oxoglutarate dehydrogenase complex dihydrolipoamide acyltransferase (E2) component
MPKLGLTMEEGLVKEFMVKVGDKVKKGDIVLIIETDKVEYEVESPYDGVVKKILLKEGDIVPPGTPILIVETET